MSATAAKPMPTRKWGDDEVDEVDVWETKHDEKPESSGRKTGYMADLKQRAEKCVIVSKDSDFECNQGIQNFGQKNKCTFVAKEFGGLCPMHESMYAKLGWSIANGSRVNDPRMLRILSDNGFARGISKGKGNVVTFMTEYDVDALRSERDDVCQQNAKLLAEVEALRAALSNARISHSNVGRTNVEKSTPVRPSRSTLPKQESIPQIANLEAVIHTMGEKLASVNGRLDSMAIAQEEQTKCVAEKLENGEKQLSNLASKVDDVATIAKKAVEVASKPLVVVVSNEARMKRLFGPSVDDLLAELK